MPTPPLALVLTAHADDCEFFAGGLAAKLADDGWDIVEVIATDNGRGSFELPAAALVSASRDVEAREAARVLGKREVRFLGHPDGFLDDVPKNELRRVFMGLIREYRPRALVTFDAFAPFEDHPDHIHVARAAVEAVAFAHLPLYHPEQIEAGHAPHLVPERWYFAKDSRHADRVVDISPYIDKKIEAVAAHTSQIRMMMTDLRMSFAAAGRHAELAAALDPDAPRPLLDMLLRAWAASVGTPHGYAYGEAFRYEYPAQHIDRALAGG